MYLFAVRLRNQSPTVVFVCCMPLTIILFVDLYLYFDTVRLLDTSCTQCLPIKCTNFYLARHLILYVAYCISPTTTYVYILFLDRGYWAGA